MRLVIVAACLVACSEPIKWDHDSKAIIFNARNYPGFASDYFVIIPHATLFGDGRFIWNDPEKGTRTTRLTENNIGVIFKRLVSSGFGSWEKPPHQVDVGGSGMSAHFDPLMWPKFVAKRDAVYKRTDGSRYRILMMSPELVSAGK